MAVIECIPNVSEGRNRHIIDLLAQAIVSVPGVSLLHTDSNFGANRTVFTFCGDVANVISAAEMLIEKATELIDMSEHAGEHPRIGAVDVCPFVPISGISADELIPRVDSFAKSIAEKYQIPIYLYEKSAKHNHRTRLEQIRNGEYENLPNKLNDKKWMPDYGPVSFNKKFGAMVTGVRNFLIAYNINLDTQDTYIAKYIAGKIRESGYWYKDSEGQRISVPGMMKNVKAIGWYISDYRCTQVSTNITDIGSVNIHEVHENVKMLATEKGVSATGSELIGLIPFKALQTAGNFYSNKQSSGNILMNAVEGLGLSDKRNFSVEEQVLEIRAGIIKYP